MAGGQQPRGRSTHSTRRSSWCWRLPVLADGLIVQWVAVSLLIKHIDHVAA
jgi:hypothetical protein